ncbi:MAG: BREX-2 system adenine-specific DNA-methyltransferase PglX, partial [Pirellulales bacterium]
DLYQDLSEAARKKYALLQTPEFVEEFILDRTLDPALDEFGIKSHHGDTEGTEEMKSTQEQSPCPPCLRGESSFKMIDPACGSGHFLLGAFPRILDRWQKQQPGGKIRDLVQQTLDSIHGVDVNPYAVAIARFRLLLMAMRACGIKRLADAPGFHFNLACGDSLLHAPLRGGQQVLDFELTSDDAECEHAYQSEDLPVLKRMLRSGLYHAVVANPPYITPKDRQLNQRYRKRFEACHMKYSLAVPFMEMLFRLGVRVQGSGFRKKEEQEPESCNLKPETSRAAGFVGQITANSFMKREFGKKLIESFLPQIDLTHVIDTSGAYIPGHGTPTVILLGRHRAPVASTIRAVMGIRGEPSTPPDPSQGLVWSAIVDQIDQPGSQSEFVSVGDSERERFHTHPWSIGGGGAAELKERLEEGATETLSTRSDSIGFMAITGEDEVYVAPKSFWIRNTIHFRGFGLGDTVRDWLIDTEEAVAFMYAVGSESVETLSLSACGNLSAVFWPYRTNLRNRLMFGKMPEESGLTWYEYRYKSDGRVRTPLSIVYGEVATHNHFVLDRGGKVFNRTAPVIKLPEDASEDDHLALLGLLNSSTACFWMKQVCHNKGSTVDQHGARQRTAPFEDFFAFNGTKVQQFPLPEGRPLETARQLDSMGSHYAKFLPSSVTGLGAPTRRALNMARSAANFARTSMIALQ